MNKKFYLELGSSALEKLDALMKNESINNLHEMYAKYYKMYDGNHMKTLMWQVHLMQQLNMILFFSSVNMSLEEDFMSGNITYSTSGLDR